VIKNQLNIKTCERVNTLSMKKNSPPSSTSLVYDHKNPALGSCTTNETNRNAEAEAEPRRWWSGPGTGGGLGQASGDSDPNEPSRVGRGQPWQTPPRSHRRRPPARPRSPTSPCSPTARSSPRCLPSPSPSRSRCSPHGTFIAPLAGLAGPSVVSRSELSVTGSAARRYKENRWDPKQLVGSGGMPSSHSATVTALTVAVGLQEGFGSSLFATAAIFASVVRSPPLRLTLSPRCCELQIFIVSALIRGSDRFQFADGLY
jgi:hypothetical protein